MKILQPYLDFFQKDIWEKETEGKPLKNFFYKFLRILISSVKGFLNDKGFDKASTLTFYFLLSLIPLVAIGFGIAQELGFAEQFKEQVKAQLSSQPQVAEKIIEFSDATLKTTKGGIIAAFGFLVLIWTVLRMIGNISSFFNEIWKVESRTLWQQIKSYVPMILLFPIFLVGSSSALVYMSETAINFIESVKFLSFLGPLVTYLFQFVAYLVSWGFLSFIYIYLPNTDVSWKAGMVAGIITGLIYLLWQWVYITFQVNASSYGVIYGSFAAIPLFMIWLNYSWLIIIFGAELTYQIQNDQNPNKKSLENKKESKT